MNRSLRHDLSHICFEGATPIRSHRSPARGLRTPVLTALAPSPEERQDDFVAWVLGRAGLDAAAYRTQPLDRRLPACLRAMQVGSAHAARDLLERKPHLLARAVSALLIGVTEFFREPGVFDTLRKHVLPVLAGHKQRLRVWSAACSSGAELYSMAILLSEAGLLQRSHLLGTDCRSDAIDRAELGLYDAAMLKLVPTATRDEYFEPAGPSKARSASEVGLSATSFALRASMALSQNIRNLRTDSTAGQYWRPVEAIRRQVHWKVADLFAGVEDGPWDVILWRNSAIYFKASSAEAIWRRLAAVLAPGGALIAGKADRPPCDLGLTPVARCVYRRAA